jgi:hypothetical protein
MFGLLKMLFYTFVAVVVGVFIGTVPIQGRTIAERIAAAYQSQPFDFGAGKGPRPEPGTKPSSPAKAPARPATRARPEKDKAVAQAEPKAVTAGQANSPDAHAPEEQEAIAKLIASRSKRRP